MGRGRRGTGAYCPLQDVSGEHFGAPPASSPMFHKPRDLGHPGTWRIRGDVPQTPGFVTGWNMAEEEDLMTLGDGLAEGAPGLESVLELRLMAQLTDVVRNHGMGGAAEKLGVSRQTLWRARTSGTLPPSLFTALERLVRETDDTEAAAQRERTEALERRVKAWEKEVRGSLEQLRSAIGDRGEPVTVELAGHLREVERRLAKTEAVLRAGPMPAIGGDEGPGVLRSPAEARPGMVTVEPQPDEEGGLRPRRTAGCRVAPALRRRRGRGRPAGAGSGRGAHARAGDRADRTPRPHAPSRDDAMERERPALAGPLAEDDPCTGCAARTHPGPVAAPDAAGP